MTSKWQQLRCGLTAEEVLSEIGLNGRNIPLDFDSFVNFARSKLDIIVGEPINKQKHPVTESACRFTYKENSKYGDKAIIWYDNSIQLAERRIYFAHEIGHILCSKPDEYRHVCIGECLGSDPEEQRATAFALDLLIPSTTLEYDMDRGRYDPRRLATKYILPLGAILEQMNAVEKNQDRVISAHGR